MNAEALGDDISYIINIFEGCEITQAKAAELAQILESRAEFVAYLFLKRDTFAHVPIVRRALEMAASVAPSSSFEMPVGGNWIVVERPSDDSATAMRQALSQLIAEHSQPNATIDAVKEALQRISLEYVMPKIAFRDRIDG
jgi:hypothetical protein